MNRIMTTKSIALLVNVVLLGAMLLAACSGTAATATTAPTAVPTTAAATTAAPVATTAAPTTAAVELPSIINWPDKIADGKPVSITVVQKPADSSPDAVIAWEEQVKRFQKKYPNVTIEGTDYAYAPDSFAALVAGNQVPTLFEVYLTDPSQMIDQGIATDLTSYIKDQKLDTIFNPDILNIGEKDGKYYGLPRFAYAMGLAYNIPMLKAAGFDAAPTTWDELATMAQKLTNRDAGVAGLSFITDGSGAAGWHMTTIAYNFGLKNDQIVNETNGKYTQNFATGPLLDAMKFVDDLRWKYDVLPMENLAWDTNGAALANGTAAMVVMAGDQFTWLRQTYPDAPINDFGFAPLPAGGADGKSVSLVGGNIAMVSSKATPEQVEAAVYWRLFTQFDPNEILANYEAGKSDPTVVVGAPELPLYVGDYEAKSEALEAEYANLPIANYKSFMDAVSSGKVGLQPEPLVKGQDFYTAMGTALSTLVTDKTADPATILKQAADTFQKNVLDQIK
jgi:ABC-type glycerol-3-phosphate transport system substrate-binding protein